MRSDILGILIALAFIGLAIVGVVAHLLVLLCTKLTTLRSYLICRYFHSHVSEAFVNGRRRFRCECGKGWGHDQSS
jgi:hypothetical protein